ncbi:MAG: class II D-tagatose-bisphosphate aldolase, non-catalytic subunit [Oscillospiraceae bacterium]|nr:class II D-tagatose-bisphosphate aldolase, non-catalytic subunit [Oscillospiraceae bacterium]
MKTITQNPILHLLHNRSSNREKGIYSCCSANEYVIRAALRRAKANDTVVLVESTANQVNQNGGYTGMTPAAFRQFLDRLAAEEQFPIERLLCGGDHLGPLTWTAFPEAQAMTNAEELIRSYVLAGFSKIHIDTSMRVADDDPNVRLSDAVIARRGARLCRAAEDSFVQYSEEHPEAPAPVYVIGSEVPIPGGAQENEDSVAVTSPADCEATLAEFRRAFTEEGLDDAWERVAALVVQPGVEFADDSVITYNRAAAKDLMACLDHHPGLVFEGHSTDYQPRERLREMVEDGVAILKVGPALTFALREGLFALEQIEKELYGVSDFPCSHFRAVLEQAMLEDKSQWAKYYHGDLPRKRYARAFSYSDRARYYLVHPKVQAAMQALLANLDSTNIPMALLSQYMPVQYVRVQSGELPLRAADLLIDRAGDCIDDYLYATIPQ